MKAGIDCYHYVNPDISLYRDLDRGGGKFRDDVIVYQSFGRSFNKGSIMENDKNEIIEQRYRNMETLKKAGIDPFGAGFPGVESIAALKEACSEGRRVRIKTQVGDRAVEVEYSPKAMSPAELQSLVDMLAGTLTEKS